MSFSCPDFSSVLEGETNIVLAVNGHMIEQNPPERWVEFCHQFLLLPKRLDELAHGGAAGGPAGNLRFCFIVLVLQVFLPGAQFVEAALVLLLILRHPGVLRDGPVDHFADHLQLGLQPLAFRFERIGGKQHVAHGFEIGNHLVPAVEQLVQR